MEKNTKYHNHQIRERRIQRMRTIRTFRQFLENGEPEVLCKSKIYIEDLSGNQKRTKIKELQKLLKDYDFYYSMSDDYRAYKRGKEQQDKILKLVREIGKNGEKIWKDYIKRNESKDTTGTGKYMSNSFFPPTPKPLSTDEKHLKRTMIYGKVYNGE